MSPRSTAMAVVLVFWTLLVLAGCTGAIEPIRETYPYVSEHNKPCDLGLLRATKDMRCQDELKRKVWHLWT